MNHHPRLLRNQSVCGIGKNLKIHKHHPRVKRSMWNAWNGFPIYKWWRKKSHGDFPHHLLVPLLEWKVGITKWRRGFLLMGLLGARGSRWIRNGTESSPLWFPVVVSQWFPGLVGIFSILSAGWLSNCPHEITPFLGIFFLTDHPRGSLWWRRHAMDMPWPIDIDDTKRWLTALKNCDSPVRDRG